MRLATIVTDKSMVVYMMFIKDELILDTSKNVTPDVF